MVTPSSSYFWWKCKVEGTGPVSSLRHQILIPSSTDASRRKSVRESRGKDLMSQLST